MMTFRGDGPRLFREAIDRALRTPEALKQWYLSLIDTLARTGVVYTQKIPADRLDRSRQPRRSRARGDARRRVARGDRAWLGAR